MGTYFGDFSTMGYYTDYIWDPKVDITWETFFSRHKMHFFLYNLISIIFRIEPILLTDFKLVGCLGLAGHCRYAGWFCLFQWSIFYFNKNNFTSIKTVYRSRFSFPARFSFLKRISTFCSVLLRHFDEQR